MTTTFATPVTTSLPAGCTARAGKLSDYTLLFEMVNSYGRYINGHDELNDPELIRLDWQNDGFEPETDIQAVFDEDGLMVGLAEAWLINSPPVHPWNWVCVHPDHLESGVWAYLLNWAEDRSRAALEIVPSGIRVAPRTGTEHTNLHGIRTIQDLGWKHIRSYFRMVTDLDAAPQVPAAPAGIVIRRYDPQTETEAVYRAFVDSFRDHFGFVEEPFERGFADFRHNLINEPGYDPDYWFVAVDRAEIAGICLCRPVDAEDAESGWVNELGVRRAWRKQGLGSLLLTHAFAAFYARGQKRAALGVDASSLTGALRLYERAGMHAVRQFDQFEKELRPGEEISTQEIE
jgi:mycothiol synthase